MVSVRVVRGWHAVTVLVIAASVVAQLALVIRGVDVLIEDNGSPAPTAERILRFFSYFTVQSNLLAMWAAATLAMQPDRDGRLWRILRVASVVGMTVTFVVYYVELRPLLDLHGVARLADIGFHYVAPVMTVLGWGLFGPWPRIDTRSLVSHLVWPVGYLAYALVLGEISGWYPYPFLDVVAEGLPRVLANSAVVTVVLLAVGATYRILDHRFAHRRAPV